MRKFIHPPLPPPPPPPTGAGIYVVTGNDSVPTGVLPNNGIVIAQDVTSGDRILFQCRSGSTMTGVGQLVDLDGNTFNIGQTSGVFSVENTGSGSHPGSVQCRNRVGAETLTAAHEGVYTCRIPDETGNVVDVNTGVYRNGFNSKDKSSGWLHHARGSSQLAWRTVMQGYKYLIYNI